MAIVARQVVPGPREIFRLLVNESSQPAEDCATFFDALAFNYLVGGTDAHAKNYSLLHASGQVRLAPLYDIASTFPYYDVRQLELAMKVGSHYELAHVTDRDGDALGDAASLSVAGSVRVRELSGRILEQLPFVTAEPYGQGLIHEIIGARGKHSTVRNYQGSVDRERRATTQTQ